MNGPAAVASLVPLIPESVEGDSVDELARAPTRQARPARRARQEPTKVARRVPKRIDLDDLPTLVVPPPVTLSSGSLLRPKEIADDVASAFDISPFESFEGDVETHIDGCDDDDALIASPRGVHVEKDAKDESAFASMLPPMSEVWSEADARITPSFSIDEVETIDAIEDAGPIESFTSSDVAANDSDDAISAISANGANGANERDAIDGTVRAMWPRRVLWALAIVAVAIMCGAGVLGLDDGAQERGRAFVVLAQNEVVPELRAIEAQARQLEGRARWIAARTR